MRFLRWPLRVLAVLAVVYLYFAFVHPHEVVPESPYYASDGGPWVIAHQGGRGLWPENTLFAFEQAIALGADVIEMDLRVTRDGEIVVRHDDTVNHTTDGSGRIADMTLAEIRQLDAGYRFEDSSGGFPYRGKGLRIPTLNEVIDHFPGQRMNIEMKSFTAEQARSLCSLLNERDAGTHVMVASFDYPDMAEFRQACPQVATSITMREGLTLYALSRIGLGSIYRGPAVALQMPERLGGHQVLDAGLVEMAREYNLRIDVWTVNRPADMERLLALGVHGIITDYPDRLLRVMGRPVPAGVLLREP